MTNNNKRPCSSCGKLIDNKDLVVHMSGEQADEYFSLIHIVDQICNKVANHCSCSHEHKHKQCCMTDIADLLVEIGLIEVGEEEMYKEYSARRIKRDNDALKAERRKFRKDLR